MSVTPKQLEKARGEVDKLANVERDFSAELSAKLADLAEAPLEAGEHYLTAALHPGQADAEIAATEARYARLQREAKGIEAGIAAARRARLATIPGVWRLEAEAKRDEAEALRAEAAALDQKGLPHLEALKQIFGCLFVPGPRAELVAESVATGSARPFVYGIDASPTTTTGLLLGAEQLEREAAVLEAKQVSQAGTVEGVDADELFEKVLAEPRRMGPSHPELVAWVAAAEAQVREGWTIERRSEHLPTDNAAFAAVPKTFTLAWGAGTINAERSGLRLSEREAPHDHSDSQHGMLP